jgi:hypothetical protein
MFLLDRRTPPAAATRVGTFSSRTRSRVHQRWTGISRSPGPYSALITTRHDSVSRGCTWPFGQVLRRPAPEMRHSRQLPASVPRRPACPSAVDCRPSGAPSLRLNALSGEADCNRFAAHASRQLEHRHMCRCCQAIVCSSAPVARGFVSNARSHDLMPRNGFGSIEK